MSQYTDMKEKMLKNVERLYQQVTEILPQSSQLKSLQELRQDLIQDYYTIVVVGEFKSGKSTFVNALLGRNIMPRDVTPTTATINAVFHSEDEEVHIVKTNGEIEKRELTPDILNQYTASSGFDPNEINYLKLFFNSPLLKNRVVLVDTPGVNDLNQHRSDVTYQFIPRADVVLFMTPLTAALKRTEQEFIQNQLMKNGLDQTVFIGNFFDRIDEEEIEDVIDFAETRIQNITGKKENAFYTLSAKEALEGRIENNEELVRYSGIQEIEEAVYSMIENGFRSQEKLNRFTKRLELISECILNEIIIAEEVSNESLEDLESQLKVISDWFQNQGIWEQKLQNYSMERQEEITFMVRKSVNHFGTRLQEDIQNRIMLYHGADVKSLVEVQLPITIRSQFTQWVEQYSDPVHDLLGKLQNELARGLSQAFKQNVKLQGYRAGSLYYDEFIQPLAAKSGNANVKAGLVMGGASTIALLLGGAFFIPIVGMAGLPFLSQKIAEKQLENIKPEILTAANTQIKMLIDDFQLKLERYIRNSVEDIKRNALEEFQRLLTSFQGIVQTEVNQKKAEGIQIKEYQQRLNDCKELLK